MGDYGIQHFFIIHSADYAGPAYRATFHAADSGVYQLYLCFFDGMLMTSLVGTLFIPNFYLMMESLHERFTRKKAAGIAVILLGIFIYSLKF